MNAQQIRTAISLINRLKLSDLSAQEAHDAIELRKRLIELLGA